MTWERKRVLVTAKAAPETSKKHGDCVCTAGITEEGEFIRLFPITLDFWRKGVGFRKFDWIEVECEKYDDLQKRKESYHIKPGSAITVVDDSLNRKKRGRADWESRSKALFPLRSSSLEELQTAFENDRTSLGLIRVKDLIDFYKTKELDEEEKEAHKSYQMYFDIQNPRMELKKTWVLHQIPHIFKYKFTCEGDSCRGHDMTCEDWELFEAYRKWPEYYGTEEKTWEKLQDRFHTKMKEADLHFLVGTHSKWPIWMIIGLYYPPKSD
jgi:hypothetical protein